MIFVIFVFIYVYWCSTRFPYQMMFASFNCNTRLVSLVEQELPILPEHPVFSAVRVAQSLAFYAVFCISLFVLLSFFLLVIVLSVLLRFTASDYLLSLRTQNHSVGEMVRGFGRSWVRVLGGSSERL